MIQLKSALKVSLLSVSLMFLSLPAAALADTQVARNIHVDLSHVDASQSCTVVGQRTRVRFDASALSFRPKRIEVFLNGMPVAANRVRYAWPEVTLDGGLLAGRNTVELFVERKDGANLKRSIVIKVGDSVHSEDGITLGCNGALDEPEDASAAPIRGVASNPARYVVPQRTTVIYETVPAYSYVVGRVWPSYCCRWGGGYYSGMRGLWAPGLSIGLNYVWHSHRRAGWHRYHGWYGHGYHRHHGHRWHH